MTPEQLIDRLAQIVGHAHIVTNEDDLRYFGQDVFDEGQPPIAVVQPNTTQELADAVKLATEHKFPVIPRGGGMSYTSGYLHNQPAVLFDMSRMNQVLEINTEDMYVRVGAGCRWVDLYEALKDSGVRTPMWGTLSGMRATIGGGMSQNSVFFGSGNHGTAADSVIGLEVVTAKGDIIRTGAGGIENGLPFMRHFGPDLTGLFTCDTGALGFKSEVVLRLIPTPESKRYLSFDFNTHSELMSAMSEISRQDLASECFGFDPFLQVQRMKRESIAKDIQTMGKVVSSASSLKDAFKMASSIIKAGRGYMADTRFSLHCATSQRTEAAAKDAEEKIRTIATSRGGKEIPNSIPTIMHANPFTPLNNMIGPQGERWLPVHALVPHSRGIKLVDAIEAYFRSQLAVIEKFGIGTGYLFASVGQSITLIEPVFFWPDALMDFHHRNVEESVLNRIEDFAPNAAARDAIISLREGLLDVFAEYGAAHFQIGRTYRYSENMDPAAVSLVQSIKRILDPDELMNPGSLGLH
jgi:FAD/FMN-containing dehydrogenase